MSSPAASPDSDLHRAPERRALLRLGVPILITQLAQMGMGVVDTIMAGRYSAVDLAGVALGGAVVWPLLLSLMGILQAITPTVSQLNGAGRQHAAGEVIPQALWMICLPATLLIVLMHNMAPFYRWLDIDPVAIPVSVGYLQATSFGLPAVMVYFVLRFLCEGLGYSRPAMMIAATALLLKIPLNYWFVFGGLGVPAMGGAGCGLSTAIVMWFEMLIMVWVALQPRFRATGWHHAFRGPDIRHIRNLLAIGLPIGATMFFEMGLFATIALMMGRLGADIVAAHTVAINVASLTFMFAMALGMAATIRIGFHIGGGRFPLAVDVAALAVKMTWLAAAVMGTLVFFGRFTIAELYSRDPEVISLAASLLLFVAGFQLIDNTQATVLGALRGFKDTQLPMLITLVGYWLVGFPVALILGFGFFGEALGAAGMWWGLIAGLLFVALLALGRLWWLIHHPAAVARLTRRYALS